MPRGCDVPDCANRHNDHGYCTTHRDHWRKWGPVWLRPAKPVSDDERFDSQWYLDEATGCHIWTGDKEPYGHGQFYWGGRPPRRKRTTAHRWAWMRKNGPVPPDMQLDHFRCDTPSCVNPDHVRPTTPRENSLRSNGIGAINAAKTHCPAGHSYDEVNTRVRPNGDRACKVCDRNQKRAQYQAQRQEVA